MPNARSEAVGHRISTDCPQHFHNLYTYPVQFAPVYFARPLSIGGGPKKTPRLGSPGEAERAGYHRLQNGDFSKGDRPCASANECGSGRFLCRAMPERDTAMAKNEKTSRQVASKAGKLLSNPKTPAPVKSVAASALTQASNRSSKKSGK